MLSYLQPANEYKIISILSPMLYTGCIIQIIQIVLPTYLYRRGSKSSIGGITDNPPAVYWFPN